MPDPGQGIPDLSFIEQVPFAGRHPVDVGRQYLLPHIMENNAAARCDKLTAGR